MVNFPDVEWIQQSVTVDPSGQRAAKDTGFVKILSTAAGGELNFGDMNTTGSGAISDTLMGYARIDAMGDASGVFNMRFFLTNVSSFSAGTYRFLERKNFHYVPSVSLNSADGNTPTVVPQTPNLSGTITEPEYPLGKPWMSGILDNDASQYVHLAVEVDVNVPVGTYGGAGAGTFRYRLLYDFS